MLWCRAPGDRGALGPLQAWPQPLLLFRVGRSLHPACHRQCESLAPAGSPCGLKTWITPSASMSCCLVQVSRSCFIFRQIPLTCALSFKRQSNLGRGANRPGNQMSRSTCVQTWPCSYYLELEKRWVPGRLSLTPLSLKFTTDKTRETLVSFPLSGINEIKKEASHFIFSSITILERDHSKHWFSSLQPSRNAVFSIIEHFWRELLLSESGAAAEGLLLLYDQGEETACPDGLYSKRLEDTAKSSTIRGRATRQYLQRPGQDGI